MASPLTGVGWIVVGILLCLVILLTLMLVR